MKTSAYLATRRNILRYLIAATAGPVASGLVPTSGARAATLPPVEVWKNPSCGCCGSWVQHMRRAGFSVTVNNSNDMDAIRRAKGVPDDKQSCHTGVVDGYVVEGHVPASDVMRLIAERPSAKGLAAPGMPASAPGMDQPGEPYTVILFGTPTGDRTYARYDG